MVITSKDLEYLITVENIKDQIKDGWTSTCAITRYIIGESLFSTLEEWDQKILEAKVHKMIVKNNLLKELK